MRWIKWTMVAVTGILPAVIHAEEPQAEGSGRLGVTFKLEPGKDERQRIYVVNEEGPQGKAQLENPRRFLQLQLNSMKREKGSYLGISASPPPAVLRKQLSLSAGMGLVVDFVVPESPAAKAGVEQYDVLQKLDDQLLVNQEQLAVLVRSRKPGDEVKLAIIRDGKPQTLTAKLSEHELEPLAQNGEGERAWTELRRVVPEPNAGGGLMPGQGKPPLGWGGFGNPYTRGGGSSVTWMEGDHSYTIVTDNEGHKTFTVKDKDGKSLFQGPINTAEQREKLSPEFKEKLGKLESRLGGTPAGPGGAIRGPQEDKGLKGDK